MGTTTQSYEKAVYKFVLAINNCRISFTTHWQVYLKYLHNISHTHNLGCVSHSQNQALLPLWQLTF